MAGEVVPFRIGRLAVTWRWRGPRRARNLAGVFPRGSGILFALGFVLYPPQFAHGLLVAVGSLWIAVAVLGRGGE